MAEQRLNKWRIGAFALPAIPISALGLPIVVYLPPFYSSHIGIDLALVGTIFMIARFWDVFTDPVLGIVSDKFSTRWGRRRHWLVISLPFLVIAGWMLFMPSAGVGAFYLVFWMFILYVGWTLMTLSHQAWGAELSPDYHERSSIQGAREFALIFGMLTVLVLPALIEQLNADATPADGVAAMGWFIIVLMPLTVAIAVFFVGEDKRSRHSVAEEFDLKTGLKMLAQNKPLRYVLLCDLFVGVAPGITGALYFFFVDHVMELRGNGSLLLLCYFAAGLIAVPGWMLLSRRFGKHRTLAFAMLYGALALPIVIFLPKGAFWPLLVGFSLYGLAFGAGAFLLRAILADVIDHDNLETGQQRTGLYYSMLTMTNKVGAALSVGITYPLLAWIGFDAGPEAVNSEFALNGLMFVYVAFPALFMLAAAYVMWNFPLDQAAQEELRAKLAARDGIGDEVTDGMAGTGQIPITGAVADKPAD